MSEKTLKVASQAFRLHAEEIAAANRKLFATLKAIPGVDELLRRNLAQCNLDPGVVERINRGELELSDALALAGLKIGNS